MKARKSKSIENIESEIRKNKRDKVQRIIGAAVVGLVAWVAMLYAANSILNESKHIEVCVAKADIPDGTKITENNIDNYIDRASVSETVLPVGYITDKSQLMNCFIQRDYLQREVITLSSVSSEDSMTRHIDNPIEISVAVASIDAAVGGILREGDYINIYSVDSTSSNQTAYNIISNAYVTKALDSNGMEIDRADNLSNATVINIIIPMDIEQRFNQELLSGTIRMSLVYNPDLENISNSIDENRDDSVSKDYITDTEIMTNTQDEVTVTYENNGIEDTEAIEGWAEDTEENEDIERYTVEDTESE